MPLYKMVDGKKRSPVKFSSLSINERGALFLAIDYAAILDKDLSDTRGEH
jgi:hypothetical protein